MSNKNLTAVTIFLLGMANVIAVVADEPKNDLRMDWFVGLGITSGGDELAEAEVEYNDDTIDEDIRAGELITLTGGIVVYFPRSAWSLQTSIGYHSDSVGDYDDAITFDRYPLELIPFYNFGNHRIGAGLSYHLSPELDLKDIRGPKVEFDDALGWLVEYDYSFSGWENSGFALGIRYMWIDYEVNEVDGIRRSGFEFDGNHAGIHANYMF